MATERVLNILEALTQRTRMTNADLSRALRVPKSSLIPILRSLERRGYVCRNDHTSTYSLTSRVAMLTQAAIADLRLRKLALPVLTDIMERTQLAALRYVLDAGRTFYVQVVEGPEVAIAQWSGPEVETYATAAGKAMLAYLSEAELDIMLRRRGPKVWTHRTITARDALLRELEQVRKRGYAISDQEYVLGYRCIAAPVMACRKVVDACIGVVGTVRQITDERLPELCNLVAHSAGVVSAQLNRSALPATAESDRTPAGARDSHTCLADPWEN